jgi:hypothetical protein
VPPVDAHTLRHCFATGLLTAGYDIRTSGIIKNSASKNTIDASLAAGVRLTSYGGCGLTA